MPSLETNLDNSTRGILIHWKFGRGEPWDIWRRCGGYPFVANVSDSGYAHVGSTNRKGWLKEQARRWQGAGVDTAAGELHEEVIPFGVLSLETPETGLLVLSWGEARRVYRDSERRAYLPHSQPRHWFAVLDWPTVSKACRLDSKPRLSPTREARIIFENQAAWIQAVDTRHDSVLETPIPQGTLVSSVSELRFFSRPVVCVEMMMIGSDELEWRGNRMMRHHRSGEVKLGRRNVV